MKKKYSRYVGAIFSNRETLSNVYIRSLSIRYLPCVKESHVEELFFPSSDISYVEVSNAMENNNNTYGSVLIHDESDMVVIKSLGVHKFRFVFCTCLIVEQFCSGVKDCPATIVVSRKRYVGSNLSLYGALSRDETIEELKLKFPNCTLYMGADSYV